MNATLEILFLCLLCLTGVVWCARSENWEVNVTAGGEIFSRDDIFFCTSKCTANFAWSCAVIDVNGNCLCDDCDNQNGRVFITAVHETDVPQKSLVFITLIDKMHNKSVESYQDLGTEKLVASIPGGELLPFEDSGPQRYLLPGKKTLRLKTNQSNFFEYAVPTSLNNKMAQHNFFISVWFRIPENVPVAPHAMVEFYDKNTPIYKLHLFQHFHESYHTFFLRNVHEDALADLIENNEWHHVVILVKHDTKTITLRIDDSFSMTKPYIVWHSATHLVFGKRYPTVDEYFADSSIFCFVLQEVHGKTQYEEDKAIAEAKGACDHV